MLADFYLIDWICSKKVFVNNYHSYYAILSLMVQLIIFDLTDFTDKYVNIFFLYFYVNIYILF